MQKYQDVIIRNSGAVVSGATVYVQTYPGGALATIYSDDGVTLAANPLLTDANGAFEFFVADGHYQLQISGAGITSKTVTGISMVDGAGAKDSALQAAASAESASLSAASAASSQTSSFSSKSSAEASALLASNKAAEAVATAAGVVSSATASATAAVAVSTAASAASAAAAAASAATINLTAPGPIGSTTPSTGAFTTLSADTRTNIGTPARTVRLLNIGGIQYPSLVLQSSAASGGVGSSSLYFGNSTTDSAGIIDFDHATNLIDFYAGGPRVASLGNTGLAITGALSATGDVSIPVSKSFKLGSGGYVFSDGNGVIEIASAGVSGGINFVTNGALRATLDASGNLGIGVVPSAWGGSGLLCLPAGSAVAFQGPAGSIVTNAYYNSGWKYAVAGAATWVNQTAGGYQWHTAPSGTAGNPITFTQAMKLDANGLTIAGALVLSGNAVNPLESVPKQQMEDSVSSLAQNAQSANYTLVLTDAGKHILHPSADTTARTFTIPANAAVAFPVGKAVTFVNQNGAGDVTIAITTDTMRLAGAGTTGSRTLAANGLATALKITATEWIISGAGLT
jgi:hypothetical protein